MLEFEKQEYITCLKQDEFKALGPDDRMAYSGTIYNGEIVTPAPCPKCGADTANLEGYGKDYVQCTNCLKIFKLSRYRGRLYQTFI